MTASVTTNHTADLAVKAPDVAAMASVAPAESNEAAAIGNDATRSVPVFSNKTNFEAAQDGCCPQCKLTRAGILSRKGEHSERHDRHGVGE